MPKQIEFLLEKKYVGRKLHLVFFLTRLYIMLELDPECRRAPFVEFQEGAAGPIDSIGKVNPWGSH